MVPVVRIGLNHEVILEAHEKLGADLIVMGTHGQTGMMSLLMGSVAEKVARGAKCPVLMVRSRPVDPA